MRGIQITLAGFLLAVCSVWGQDTPGITQARSFRDAVARLQKPEFFNVLLGSNRSSTHPELSRTLDRIASARTDHHLREALTGHSGDARTLSTVLEVATGEAETWKSGRVLRKEAIDTLWSLLERGSTGSYRLEGYGPPKELETWLVEEQLVNEKISALDISIGELPKDLNPLNRPVYWLPHVEIPIEETHLLQGGTLDPAVRSQLIFRRSGRTYVRYFVHPASVRSKRFQTLLRKYPVRVEYLATPTSSPRSLVVWSPYGEGRWMLVKTSMDLNVGRLQRVNPLSYGVRATSATRALDAVYAQGSRPYLREPLVVYPKTPLFGMIVREAPPDFPGRNGNRWVPGLALVSRRPDGQPPLLVQMIRRSSLSPLEYLSQKLLTPLLETYGEITLKQGLVGQPHQQNIVWELGPDGHLTGRMLIRDMDSFRIDVEQRMRQGLDVRDLFHYRGPRLVRYLRLRWARMYYRISYPVYVRQDWSCMLGDGLRRYFPEVTRPAVEAEMDRIFTIQVRRHLGVAFDERQPNRAVHEFRRRARATGKVQKVSQKSLGKEFERLASLKRVLWLGKKARVGSEHTLLAQNGVIEMRQGGRVIALALEEPKGTPTQNVRPQEKSSRSAVTASPPRSSVSAKVKESAGKTARGAMGMGFFAGGFLLKETIQGIAQKDAGRIKKAVKEMGRPGFIGGFAVFAGAQHAVEKGVKVTGMKGAMASVTKFALPLYAAVGIMHAVSGKSTPLDAASDATSFGAMMLAMMPADMVLRAALYPALLAAGPAGWAGIAAIEITKAALLLWGSEKIRPYVKEALAAIGKKTTQTGKAVVANTRKAATWVKGQAQAARERLSHTAQGMIKAFSWMARGCPISGWGGSS